MNYESLELKDLRDKCRQAAQLYPESLQGKSKSGFDGRNQINFWNKAECISYLYALEGKSTPSQDNGRAEPWQDDANEDDRKPTPKPAEKNAPQPKNEASDDTPESDDDLVSALIKTLDGKLKAKSLDADQVTKIIDDKLKALTAPVMVNVKRYESPEVHTIGVCHNQVPTMIKLAAARVSVFLVGPAGSGKTTAARQVSEALGLTFYYQAVNAQTTKADLMGYCDAHGVYRATHLRKAYEHGGVFLLDEVDAGNPNVLTTLNALLDNKVGAFHDAIIPMHDDFVCIAAGNTYGRGKDRQYVGRNELDGATLDRFYLLEFDYDESLELSLSTQKEWALSVQKIRQAVYDLGERLIVSPRASIKGSTLLDMGDDFTPEQLRDALIFRGVNPEVKSRILSKAGL